MNEDPTAGTRFSVRTTKSSSRSSRCIARPKSPRCIFERGTARLVCTSVIFNEIPDSQLVGRCRLPCGLDEKVAGVETEAPGFPTMTMWTPSGDCRQDNSIRSDASSLQRWAAPKVEVGL
eukprot:1371712-Amorphochlora_amoeboformis.AAC.1